MFVNVKKGDNMKKILIIGAGIGQIPIVNLAKQMGLFVIVVTIPGEWPAIELADDVWYIDIYDKEKILVKAQSEGINAVISDQNDLMMPTVAYIAEHLGLPGNQYSQVQAYCNKILFRNNCDACGVPAPKYIGIYDESFDPDTFDCRLPWIIKPADSQSSIGVQRIDDKKELKKALAFALEKSSTKSAILEELFEGKELVCEGFIENGKYYNLSFADRNYFKLDNLLIPSQTLFPSIVPERIKSSILEYEKRMAAFVNPNFGITHSEYLYNENSGEIRIVETALRGGGVFISSHLVPLATGININEVLLKKAANIPVDVEDVFKNKKEKASGYICFYLKEGLVKSIEGIDKLNEFNFVKMIDISGVKVGEKTKKMTYKGARLGPILVNGENREDLEKNIKTVQKTLSIIVDDGDKEINGIIWA